MPVLSNNYPNEKQDLLSRINFFQIGFQKCGTTFFENSIYLNHPEIRCAQVAETLFEDILLENFIYPDGLEYERETFEKEFSKVVEKFFPSKSQKVNGIIFESFTYEYEKRFDRKNVLCRLKESFPDAKIITLIRNQESWVRSLYSQYIKNGGLLSFYHFMEVFLNNPLLNNSTIDWYPLIFNMHEIFGRENILVVLQEELKDHPQGVADRVYDFLGVDKLEIDPEVINPSYREMGISLSRVLNHLFKYDLGTSNYGFSRRLGNCKPIGWQKLRHEFTYKVLKNSILKIANALDKFFSKKPSLILTEKQRIKLYDKYFANNRKLAKLLNVDLSKHGYPLNSIEKESVNLIR